MRPVPLRSADPMKFEGVPDSQWVAQLTGRTRERAAAAIAEAAKDRRLFGYIAAQHRREGRDSYIEIDAPFELHALARLNRPQHVVEVGVSSGVSSAYLLAALRRNGSGRLHSIDLPAFEQPPRAGEGRTKNSWSLPPGRGPGWAVPPSLRTHWDLRIGDKRDVIPILAEQLPTVDLLVYDVPHDCTRTSSVELRALRPLFHAGAVVIIDHGPGGGRCPAIAKLAKEWKSRTCQRVGSGLFATQKRANHRGSQPP